MVKLYVKKQVVIEAMIHEGGYLGFSEAQKFVGKALFPYVMNPSDIDTLHIETLEGLMAIKKGDYIIKGVKGEFYPCKPDIFEMTYSAVPVIEPSPLTPEEEQLLIEDAARENTLNHGQPDMIIFQDEEDFLAAGKLLEQSKK